MFDFLISLWLCNVRRAAALRTLLSPEGNLSFHITTFKRLAQLSVFCRLRFRDETSKSARSVLSPFQNQLVIDWDALGRWLNCTCFTSQPDFLRRCLNTNLVGNMEECT